MFKRSIRNKLLAASLITAMAVPAVGCGTILYPNRRGQSSGNIDTGVAVMDGLWLLFFIVPGVIAFVVDFSNGAIYESGGRR